MCDEVHDAERAQPDSELRHNWILSRWEKVPRAFAVFLHSAGQFKYSYYHNLSRIKIAQNKWQMAGNRALCQEMARGRENGLLSRIMGLE